jgi:F0F1-type ATP synthase gamma subunit
MGLDMYLSRNGQEIGYWRKANAIHKWFVDNTQNGEDNCQENDVSIEQILVLYNLCKKVIKNPEKYNELLPMQEGFFFGSTKYSDYYLEYVKDTKKILKKCLNNPLEKYQYQASW